MDLTLESLSHFQSSLRILDVPQESTNHLCLVDASTSGLDRSVCEKSDDWFDFNSVFIF